MSVTWSVIANKKFVKNWMLKKVITRDICHKIFVLDKLASRKIVEGKSEYMQWNNQLVLFFSELTIAIAHISKFHIPWYLFTFISIKSYYDKVSNKTRLNLVNDLTGVRILGSGWDKISPPLSHHPLPYCLLRMC